MRNARAVVFEPSCCRPPQLRFVGLQYLFLFIPRVAPLRGSTLGYYTFAPLHGAFEFPGASHERSADASRERSAGASRERSRLRVSLRSLHTLPKSRRP